MAVLESRCCCVLTPSAQQRSDASAGALERLRFGNGRYRLLAFHGLRNSLPGLCFSHNECTSVNHCRHDRFRTCQFRCEVSCRGHGASVVAARAKGSGRGPWNKMKNRIDGNIHKMVDEETGEKVIVLGTGVGDVPVPTAKDLKWEPCKTALPGGISDNRMYKMMAATTPEEYFIPQGDESDNSEYSDDDEDISEEEDNADRAESKESSQLGATQRVKMTDSKAIKESASASNQSGNAVATSTRTLLDKLRTRRLDRKKAEGNLSSQASQLTGFKSSESALVESTSEGYKARKVLSPESTNQQEDAPQEVNQTSRRKHGLDDVDEDDDEDEQQDEILSEEENADDTKQSSQHAGEEARRTKVNSSEDNKLKTTSVPSNQLTDGNEEAGIIIQQKEERARRKKEGSKSKQVSKQEDSFYSIKSFKKLGASEEIIQALASLEVDRPSEIQALSFKDVLKGNSCIIAEQTGSGKTLAYLAPLVQRLREQEEKGNFSTAKNPRVLVLVPTSELAAQVLNVCRGLSRKCPLKSMVATGGFKWKTQVQNLEYGPDIVVATPGRFLHHLEEGTLELNKLRSVVLDEVDILFEEEEFVEAMQKIRSSGSPLIQYIHVTATLPTDVHDKILQKHPDSVPVLGPSLHLTAPGLDEILVDCSGNEVDEKTPETAFLNKKVELLNLVEQRPVSKTIIFCNKIDTCRKVENILKRYDRPGKSLSVLPYHAALTQEARLKSMQNFLRLQPEIPTFLVCTDRASRGLDSVGVEHVILFDFPRDPSEYIRRVGRTARAGGAGKVFVFVVGKQVSLARKIMARNEKRHPVHSVPGAA